MTIGFEATVVRRLAQLIFCLTLTVACASCHSLRISSNKTIPPTFNLSAGIAECCTTFNTVKVFDDFNANHEPVWEIRTDYSMDARRSDFDITYGVVPEKFTQAIPKTGIEPPLVEGKTYLVIAGDGSYVPWARICFYIDGGKTIERVCPR